MTTSISVDSSSVLFQKTGQNCENSVATLDFHVSNFYHQYLGAAFLGALFVLFGVAAVFVPL
jgi:hypothetical protein